jgi:hypothetical protein
MMTTRLRWRIGLLALAPLSALMGYLYLDHLADSLPADLTFRVDGVADWLAVCATLFVVNYVIAWFHRFSWPMTMGRLLVWGLGAYLCISNLVDLFGANREEAWQIVGLEESAAPQLVASLRGNALGWSLCLIMAIVAIAVGFEKEVHSREEED